MLLMLGGSWILPTIITVLVVAAVIGGIIWFTSRTPDNLQGHYVIPFAVIIIAFAIFVIIMAWV